MVRKNIDILGIIRYTNEHDKYHREDGPAIEYPNGDKWWYINGILHRIAGPAIEFANGYKAYYIMDRCVSYNEWFSIKDFPLLW